MSTIITPEIITDLHELNPGCEIPNIFTHQDACLNVFEFDKCPKPELKFKPIPSFDNLYEINENGTEIRNVNTGKPLKIILDMHHSDVGYYATFINFKGIVRRVMIHKAVAEAWLGEKPDGLEVDHIDRNPHNNDYHNLRYVTHSEQMKNRILSDRIIEQAKANCRKYLVERVMKPVKIISPTGEICEFESLTKGAIYLSRLLKMNCEYVRKKVLGAGVSELKGYRMIYVTERLKQLC